MSNDKIEKPQKKHTVLKVILIIFILVPLGIRILFNIIESIAYSKMTDEEKIEYDLKKKEIAEKEEQRRKEQELKEICETDNSVIAYDKVKDYVKNTLKAPSTAKFPSKSDIKIIKNKDVYIINGYVDAQNSYGAMIRTKYLASIKQVKNTAEKSSWVMLSCEEIK